MKIVHIIDSFSRVNYGIWNAVANTAKVLASKYGYDTYLIYPDSDYSNEIPNITVIPIGGYCDKDAIKVIKAHNFTVSETIIVTHGCWQFPTRWGYCLKKNGYRWVYVPHGMLEPWSLKQKFLKKWIYYRLVEGKYAQKADRVRAVGQPEFINLKKSFSNTILVPNGVECNDIECDFGLEKIVFLFMARLHHKKGVDMLIDAWKQSKLFNSDLFALHIAGPDDGLGSYVKSNTVGNIKYLGAIYNEDKKNELSQATFYILPSFSEGFPTSVIEAMSYGLVPIITEGCNFPEAIKNGVARLIHPQISSIIDGVEDASSIHINDLLKLRADAISFVAENYSLEVIASKLHKLYSEYNLC